MFAVLIVLVIAVALFIVFPLARVVGDSMLPTYVNDDVLLTRRILFKKHHEFEEGAVYVFTSPVGDKEAHFIIKRVKYYAPRFHTVYIEGDNKEVSFDSRYFGSVNCRHVVSKVIRKVRCPK